MNDAPQDKVRPIKGREEFEAIFGKEALWTLEEVKRQLDTMLRGELEDIRLKRKESKQPVVATNWFDIDPDHPESFPFEVRIHKGTEPLTFVVEICPLPEDVSL